MAGLDTYSMQAPVLQRLLLNAYNIEEEIITAGMFVSMREDRLGLVCLGLGERHLVTVKLKLVPQGIEHELVSMVPVKLITVRVNNEYKRLMTQINGRVHTYQLCVGPEGHGIWQNFTHCLKNHNSDQQWVEEAMQFPKASSTGRIVYDPYYVSFLNKVMQSYKQRLIQIVKERSGPRSYNPSSSLHRSTSLCNLLPSVRVGDTTYQPLLRTEGEPCIKYGRYTLDEMKRIYKPDWDDITPDPTEIIEYPDDLNDQSLNNYNNNSTEPTEHQEENRKNAKKAKKRNILKKILRFVLPCCLQTKPEN